MEDIILLGSFAAIAVFGYFLMAKVDHFLDTIQQEDREPEPIICFHIATSCFSAIPAVSNIVEDIHHRYPNVHCKLSVGYEQEVIKSFACGEADVAIISADSDAESQTLAQWKRIALNPKPFCLDNGIIKVNTVGKEAKYQKVLWKRRQNEFLVIYFIHRLCGRQI